MVSERKIIRKHSKWRQIQDGDHRTPFWSLSVHFSRWHHPAFDSAYKNTSVYQFSQFIYKNSHPYSILKFIPCLYSGCRTVSVSLSTHNFTVHIQNIPTKFNFEIHPLSFMYLAIIMWRQYDMKLSKFALHFK